MDKQRFGRHRKIMPFEPGSVEALREASREKAASLNQHVLGYGAAVSYTHLTLPTNREV